VVRNVNGATGTTRAARRRVVRARTTFVRAQVRPAREQLVVARLLLLGGVPLREPVARHGPFVMNTRQQRQAAMDDFHSGKMGEITRTAEMLELV
jgi:redox-sensitive bicupin YhaK (pirin superfamily)